MRAVIQRVKEARVSVREKVVGEIDKGMVILLGIGKDDRKEDAKYLADKVANLRIFEGDTNLHELSGRNVINKHESTRIKDGKKRMNPALPTKYKLSEARKGGMNLSLLDIEGEALVVSQFTLYGDTKKGRRPSFTQAAEPKKAEKLYERFIGFLEEYNLKVASGAFGARMLLEIHNDGPVTFVVNTEKK